MQQQITELSDPTLRISGKPFLTAYAQGVNNTQWGMTYVWTGAPYENKTVDDVNLLTTFFSLDKYLNLFSYLSALGYVSQANLSKIAYVFDIISKVSKNYSIDTSRIYACGKSNGGGFTTLLACRPDTSVIFAGFAAVSPALYENTYSFFNCSPSYPVPILHAHGVEDAVAPFYGTTINDTSHGPEPDVRWWRRQWTEINWCSRRFPGEWAQPNATEVHPGTWEEVWDCPGAEVRSLTIEGLGHSWPSTLGLDMAGSPNQTTNFNFTQQHLVQFFSRHRLQQR